MENETEQRTLLDHNNLCYYGFRDALDRRLPDEVINKPIHLRIVSLPHDRDPEFDITEWAPFTLGIKQREWNVITGWYLHDEVYEQLKSHIRQGNTLRGDYRITAYQPGRIVAVYPVNISYASWTKDTLSSISIT